MNTFIDNKNIYEIWTINFNKNRIYGNAWYNSVISKREKMHLKINKVNVEMYVKNWGFQEDSYEDSKQFAKIFRSVTGISPIEFRSKL